MTAYAIAKTKWILKLAPQLTGKAQQAYAALPILILIDCIHIKIHTEWHGLSPLKLKIRINLGDGTILSFQKNNARTQQFGRPHAGDYKLRIQSCIRAYHKACTHD